MPVTETTSFDSTLGHHDWPTSDAGLLERFSRFLIGDAHLTRRVTVRVRSALVDAVASRGNAEGDLDACAMRAVTQASWQVVRELRVASLDHPLLRLTAAEQQVLFRRLVLGQSIERIGTSLQCSPAEVRRLQRHALARLAQTPAATQAARRLKQRPTSFAHCTPLPQASPYDDRA